MTRFLAVPLDASDVYNDIHDTAGFLRCTKYPKWCLKYRTLGVPSTFDVPCTLDVPSTLGVSSTLGVVCTYGVPCTIGVPITLGVSSTHGVPCILGVPRTLGVPCTLGVPSTLGVTCTLGVRVPLVSSVPLVSRVPLVFSVPLVSCVPLVLMVSSVPSYTSLDVPLVYYTKQHYYITHVCLLSSRSFFLTSNVLALRASWITFSSPVTVGKVFSARSHILISLFNSVHRK